MNKPLFNIQRSTFKPWGLAHYNEMCTQLKYFQCKFASPWSMSLQSIYYYKANVHELKTTFRNIETKCCKASVPNPIVTKGGKAPIKWFLQPSTAGLYFSLHK